MGRRKGLSRRRRRGGLRNLALCTCLHRVCKERRVFSSFRWQPAGAGPAAEEGQQQNDGLIVGIGAGMRPLTDLADGC
jgi:hypothetical protein